MFETIINFFKKLKKHETKETNSKEQAKERLHLVLMQDRANVSADFLEMMKQEIIEVIKKYIEVEENSIDVRLTNEIKEDGTTGAPSLYANIPILNIRNEMKKETVSKEKEEAKEINVGAGFHPCPKEEKPNEIEEDSKENEEKQKEEKQKEENDINEEIKEDNKEETKTNEDEANTENEEVKKEEADKKEDE